jgi:chemotaxis protein CheD
VDGEEPHRLASHRVPADVPRSDPQAYVHPGHLFVSATPAVATTILGTCVAVCLFDDVAGIGGLNHYMLPTAPRAGEESAKFGDVAIRQLVAALCGLGAVRQRLEAKVFGGMTGRSDQVGLLKDLGARNVAVAMESLGELGIPVVAQDVRGPRSRKLIFQTAEGRAWVRHF